MRYKEIRDLTISAVVLALAFGIGLSGGYSAFTDLKTLTHTCLLALAAVSSGFILHELGHRYLARRYDCVAVFTMWPLGLLIALFSSLYGFIFASPGAVTIRCKTDTSGQPTLTLAQSGQISLTGPAMNILLALVFMIAEAARPAPLFSLGAAINTWLAIFNLIPFGPLDGTKVFQWNKGIWFAAIAVAVGLFFLKNYFS